MAARDIGHLLGHPAVVAVGEAQHRHVVLDVRVEAGGEEHELRLVFLERRQPHLLHRAAQLFSARAGGERHVVHVRRRVLGAAVRIERMLEDRGHQHVLVVREDVLGAVAVMHVEVDDRDALKAMLVHRMARGHCDVVEDAEPHRSCPARVVARRPHRTEGARRFAFQHQIGGQHAGARRA